MDATFFYLKSCNTCLNILKLLPETQAITLHEIKSTPITPEQLDGMHALAGSYEALFSRRSREYAARGLAQQTLTEADYRRLILDHYSFLKRPVLVLDGRIWVGSDPKAMAAWQALTDAR